MPYPLDVGNSLNWDLALRNTYLAKTSALSTKSRFSPYLPIPAITLVLDSYILAIGAKSSMAKSHWYLAANVTPRLLFSPSSTSDFISAVQSDQQQKIPLNQLTLVRFTDFGLTPYLLEIKIPPWHREMYLEVWKYSGEVFADSTNS